MNRRDFLRRSAPVAAVAAVAPISLLAGFRKPNVRHDANGRLIVDGESVTLDRAALENGMTINASQVSLMSCVFTTSGAPAIQCNDTSEIPAGATTRRDAFGTHWRLEA